MSLVCAQIFHTKKACLKLRKQLDKQMEKYNALCDTAEVALKNNFLKFGKKNIKVKKRDCNRNDICPSLQYSVYGRTGRGNTLKSRI